MTSFFVPTADNIVSLTGAIQRPLRYELLAGETLEDAINYAGGLLPQASPEAITIRRRVEGEIVVLDADLNAGGGGLGLQSSDVVIVGSQADPVERFVAISGAVALPGEYAFTDGMTLVDLIKKGQLKEDSRQDIAYLRRKNPDGTAALLPLSIYEVQNNSAANLPLQLQDELIVFSQATFARPATFSVSGAVNKELTDYPFSSEGNLTVADALLLSGGLLANASNVAFLIRTNPANKDEQQYLRLDLDNPTATQQRLRSFDRLVVYSTERFTDDFQVTIRGAVREPGNYTYDPSLGLADLFTLAGGLKIEAARNKIDVFRLQLSQNEPTQTLTQTLEIDENFQPINGGDFTLNPYDVVVVRNVPEFELISTVRVEGEVRYPGDYALDADNLRLTDLIQKAGGLTLEAFPPGAVLYREGNGIGNVVIRLDEALSNNSVVSNITLKDGDILRVPKALDLVSIRPTATRAPEAYPDTLYNDGTIDVAFTGEKTGKWYIDHYAAGFADRARKKSLTVQYPNGELGRTKSFLGLKSYPKVRPGSLVRVDFKPPKRERRQREEPVDWVGVSQVILGGVTTTITLFLLIDRL